MATADHIGKGPSGMDDAMGGVQGVKLMIGADAAEVLFAALGQVVNRIEACGASPELTSAVCLASDLRQAVGNQYNKPNPFALKRVLEALSA
jgi:hypothetical protein